MTCAKLKEKDNTKIKYINKRKIQIRKAMNILWILHNHYIHNYINHYLYIILII